MRKTKTKTDLDEQASDAMIEWAEHYAASADTRSTLEGSLDDGGMINFLGDLAPYASHKAARVLDLLGRIGQKLTKRVASKKKT